MSRDGLTRREAGRIVLGGAIAAAAGLAVPSTVQAQPSGNRPPKPPTRPGGQTPATSQPATAAAPPESFLAAAMKRGRTHDWVLKPIVHIQAYQEDTANAPKDRPLIIGELKFQTAAVLFPVIRGTASSETDIDAVTSKLRFNDREQQIEPQYNESYHSGVRLGRWEMRDKTGREVDLELAIPMTCWETELDERVAAKAKWPSEKGWPDSAKSTLGKQAMIDSDPADARALKELVSAWTEGKPPNSVPPLMLAKAFAARAVQAFQASGNGEDYNRYGAFTGLKLQGPAATIARGVGSPHDITAVLVGAYRAAGLPARVVVGYDNTEKKDDDSVPFVKDKGGTNIRTWAEFCLFDEEAGQELWVPVDVARMRKRSSQVPRFDQPWKYFGSHDELEAVLPFAFHFIPPTTVVSYGYAFWGWFTTPTTQVAEHWVRFNAQTRPKRPQPRRPDRKRD